MLETKTGRCLVKDLAYKEGTVLPDGQRCGRGSEEVKLKMKDRKMLNKTKDELAQRLAPLLPPT